MAEHLRDALRDFALQKMRDLEAERAKKSKKEDDSGSKSPKSTKIKINRDASKLISGSSKKADETETVKSESVKGIKRHHDESDAGDSSKIKKLMKLYEEDASNAVGKDGGVSVNSQSEQSECKKTTDEPVTDGPSVKEQDGRRTVKSSGWTKIVKEEPMKTEPQFKGLLLSKKVESDIEVAAEKKSVPSSGEKKVIKINIQTKLLELPKGPETVTKNGSDSDSESSSDDDSDDSEDENQAADGLPWRTILEDGELTPSSDEEEEKPEDHDVKEKGEDVEKSIEENEKEVLKEKGEDKEKKKSSKHKHKSKHKKHKHKKSKKKKSKHKKDKKEKDISSDLKNDRSSTSEQKKGEGKDSKVSGNEPIDIKHKGDKTSSSRRRSKDEKEKESRQKEEVLDDRKGRSSSSSSRRTSEEREGRKSREEKISKADSTNDEETMNEERKEKSRRSHSESRSSSKEKSQIKDVREDKRKENSGGKVIEEKDQGRDKEEKKRSEKDEKPERRSRSSEKVSHRESSKKSKKTDEDDEYVPVSEEKLGGSASGTKGKHSRHQKEECKNDIECDDKGSGTTLLLEKEKAAKTDSEEESRTVRDSTKSTSAAKSFTVTISSDPTSKTHTESKSDASHQESEKHSRERMMKEEKEQKEDSRKEDRKEEKRDSTKEKSRSRHEETRREKRHKEKGKDKEDKKRHHSKKHHMSTKVKIDHLEHDFPSAEEYAEDSGNKMQSEKKNDMKADVKSEISFSDKGKTPGTQAAPVNPTEASVPPSLDGAPAESAVRGKERLEEQSVSAESKKTLTDHTSANPSLAKNPEEMQKMPTSDTDVKATIASAKHIEPISEVKDSITATKNPESSSTKEDVTKMGTETRGGVDNSKAIENKGAKLAKNSESAVLKNVAAGRKEDLTSSEQKEEGTLSTASSTDQPVKTSQSSEKNVESKAAEKATDKETKKRKKEKSDGKEEGAIDSEIEEGEIIKKHKKSKKKDKKKDRNEKDRNEKDRKDRSERDRSEHKDKKHKRRHSDSRSNSRSHSQSRKRHKGSRSRSRSDDDGDSDISIGKTKMVEKSYFSESRGCWVTRMVPKENDSSSSSGYDDGNEPYDIGDTYIRHPPHDRRSVFDRLGGGSSGRSRGRYNDRYDRHSRYGYSRRRGHSYSRSRSRSRSRSSSPKFQIDKKKLLEIAKANALQRMRAGELPPNLPIPESMKKAADSFEVNESIQKFTDRCKALANLQGGSSDDDSPVNKPVGSDDEDEDGNEGQKPFVRHPFKVKEAAPIVMNIKNAVQIPVASKDKLRVQFPVSSGSQHRKKEEEIIIANANDPYGQWTAVEKPEPKQPAAAAPAAPAAPTTKASTTQPPATSAPTPATQATPAATATTPSAPAASAAAPAVAGPHIPGLTNVQPPQPVPEQDKVFEDTPGFSYDIGQIVSARLKAARALQSNPNNVEALTVLHHSQKQIQTWAHSSKKPGLFTGSTDATFLRPEELGNPNRKNQAWIKKDMFLTAAPVSTDIGRSLMHKMGWKQGEGLGKNKEGALNPLLLEIKTDRQGLVAAEEKPKKKGDVSKVIRKDLSGKHPVMALNELCNKRRWGKPNFEVVRDDGPPHKKNFVFKVRIRNEEYVPTVPSGNKKDAKAMAATVALQKMGLLPS